MLCKLRKVSKGLSTDVKEFWPSKREFTVLWYQKLSSEESGSSAVTFFNVLATPGYRVVTKISGLCLKNEAYTVCRALVPSRGSYWMFAKKDDVYTVCSALVPSHVHCLAFNLPLPIVLISQPWGCNSIWRLAVPKVKVSGHPRHL